MFFSNYNYYYICTYYPEDYNIIMLLYIHNVDYSLSFYF